MSCQLFCISAKCADAQQPINRVPLSFLTLSAIPSSSSIIYTNTATMSVRSTIKRINSAIHDLYTVDNALNYIPLVCIVCDRFVKPDNITYIGVDSLIQNKSLLTSNYHSPSNNDLKLDYTIRPCRHISPANYRNLLPCLLSPRSQFIQHTDRRKKSGYIICTECNRSILSDNMPLFAIANNFAIGKTPPCLSELSQIELAMITPVKTFGYCFSFTGGAQKQLKGTLSYYKVSTSTIVTTAAQLEKIGLNNHVVVLIYGRLTPQQKENVEKKYN